jgi:hypothetical protein
MHMSAGYEIKAATLRAYLKVLERHAVLDAVRARLDDKMRAIIADPPPASSWIDGGLMETLMAAVEAERGDDGVRQLARESQLELVPMLLPLIEGVLRLFGTSPASLLSRMALVTRGSLRGAEFEWTQSTERSGVMQVRFPARTKLPHRALVSFEGSFALVLELCRKQGTVSPGEVLPGGSGGRFTIRWT